MTTELEQEFFNVFGIEPEEDRFCLWECKIPELENVPCQRKCKYQRHDIYYPEITDRKLLEMICILSAYNYIFEDLKADDIEQLKEEIIKLFFDYPLIAEEEKANIQQLFKEEE